MRCQTRTFRTTLGLREVKHTLRVPLRRGVVTRVAPDDDGLTPPDFAIEVTTYTVTSGRRLRISIDDAGEFRIVSVTALGDGSFARAMGGVRHTFSTARSIAWADDVETALREADPALETL